MRAIDNLSSLIISHIKSFPTVNERNRSKMAEKRCRIITTLIMLITLSFSVNGKDLSFAVQAQMIIKTAGKYHYSPRNLDDNFSKAVYESMLNLLDPYKLVFTKESIGKLDSFKFSIDDQIKENKLSFLEATTSMYMKQLNAIDSLLQKIQSKNIDLTNNDTLWLGSKIEYSNQCNLKDRWDKWTRYLILLSLQSRADSVKVLPVPSSKEIGKILDDVISRELCRIRSKINPAEGIKNYTGTAYLKAISNAFDPHTEYMSAVEMKEYETSLSKLAGHFGIRLDFNMAGEIEIAELMPGGPAWRSNNINEGDVILDIRKSDGKKMDLGCARLSDVYDFLSSIDYKPTSFKIRKKNGNIISVTLKKEILDVEENTIRSFCLKGSNNNIGHIYLPSFYNNFNYDSYFSSGCANDITKELIKLKSTSIDGLILDLRSNGGGTISEALRLAGIFIDFGTLCLTHSRGTNPEIQKDNARGTIYNGPLVLLVNSSSASASEMFAGIMQDYNRAVIVGSTTFGKGTIQQTLPVDAGNFDSLIHYKGNPLGFLVLTTGSFYRITGKSCQTTGITPDIELPEPFKNILERESSFNGALKLGTINKKTYYHPLDNLPLTLLRNLSEVRIKEEPGFQYINNAQMIFTGNYSGYPVPLEINFFQEYVKNIEKLDDSLTVRKKTFEAVLPDSAAASITSQEKEDNKIIAGNINKDIYINEAYNIINDLAHNKGKENANEKQ
jgi:carboxyl-terminal processing protease